MLALSDAAVNDILTDIVKTGATFDPVATFVGLAVAVPGGNPPSALGDLTEATGDLGIRVPITTWSAPYKLQDGRWAVDGPVCKFRPGDASEGQAIQGYFLASALTGGALKAYGPIQPAVPLADENSMLSIVPRISVDPQGRWGAEIVWNG